jgi:hypothetical protein
VYAECLAWPILRVLLWIAGLVWNRVPGDAIGDGWRDAVIGGSWRWSDGGLVCLRLCVILGVGRDVM